MKKGKLVVIEGIDGSGKTTQIELLKKNLALQGLALEAISFPRYDDNAYGMLVNRYLEGEFGKLGEVDPHFLALMYAGDRLLAKPKIESWLSEGKLVIANRYVSASKAHLGVNLPEEKRQDFFNWLDELEYKTNGIPKEDQTILLSVDPKVAQQNILVKVHLDIHEQNLKHLQEANKIYLELAKEENWQVVYCMDDGKMKTKEKIQQQILENIKKLA